MRLAALCAAPRYGGHCFLRFAGAFGISKHLINAAQQLAECILADIELVDLQGSKKCRHLFDQGQGAVFRVRGFDVPASRLIVDRG